MMYSTAFLADVTGATPRQLHTWAAKGWLSSPAPGTGRSREWSEEDLNRATLMMRFINVGFTVERAYKLTAVLMTSKDPTNGVRIKLGPEMWVIVKGLV